MRPAPQEGLDSVGLQNLTILLFGNDKVGKTSTGNVILNSNSLPQNNYNDETGDPVCNSETTRAVPGKLIEVIDTPGFGQYRTEVIEAIKRKSWSVRGKFVVLFVVRAKHVSYDECKESIRNFKEVFGRNLRDQIIVVVTHSDNLGGIMNVENFLSSCSSQLRKFITKHSSQVCFFDNVTSNSDIRRSQVKKLMSIIESGENSMNESQQNTGSWNFLNLSLAAVVIAGIVLGAIYAAR